MAAIRFDIYHYIVFEIRHIVRDISFYYSGRIFLLFISIARFKPKFALNMHVFYAWTFLITIITII